MRAFIFLCVLLGALLLACGSDESSDAQPTPPPDLDAAQILTDSQVAVAGLQGFHFVLSQENATIPLPPTLDLEAAEGNVVLPDRLEAELEAEVQDVNVSVDAIAIGSDTWITNPFTRQWQKLNVDLRDFADLGALLPTLLPAVQNPRVVGEGSLDGVATHVISGEASSGDLQDALPFSLPTSEVRLELWIGMDDLLPRRVRVIGPLIAGEADDALRQIDLTRLNEPARITPP